MMASEGGSLRRNPMDGKTPEERRKIAAKGHATQRRRKLEDQQRRQQAMAVRDGLRREIDLLEAKRNALSHQLEISAISGKVTGAFLLSEEEIVSSSATYASHTGVYFLISGQKVVYVGQSFNVFGRIPNHVGIAFDSYAFVSCDRDQLDVLESLYIHLLRPVNNGSRADGSKYAPLTLCELLTHGGNVA